MIVSDISGLLHSTKIASKCLQMTRYVQIHCGIYCERSYLVFQDDFQSGFLVIRNTCAFCRFDAFHGSKCPIARFLTLLFVSGRRQTKAALASTKADLPFLPETKDVSFSTSKQFLGRLLYVTIFFSVLKGSHSHNFPKTPSQIFSAGIACIDRNFCDG